jgi:hypothetical protein
MRFRLAKEKDCEAIVDLHYQIRKTYSAGIFAKLGKPFLRAYYKIVLKDINSIVVCAEDSNGILQGFCSATLDSETHLANLKRHKIGLAIGAFSSLISKPSILKDLIHRYNVVKNNSNVKIITTKGARSEYWVWRATNQDSLSSIEMYFAQFKILKALGIKEVFGEIDIENKKILKFQLANGGEIIDRVTLPDGRERVMVRINLETWKQRI